ncbi:hypothetical protein DE156_005372 [Clostridium beijerinckii]|nr:hypothetical protein [Clostridium beijerinckii]
MHFNDVPLLTVHMFVDRKISLDELEKNVERNY